MTTWYDRAKAKAAAASHDITKEAGITGNIMMSIVGALVLVLMGSTVENAARRFMIRQDVLEQAQHDQGLQEKARKEYEAIKASNEHVHQLTDEIARRQGYYRKMHPDESRDTKNLTSIQDEIKSKDQISKGLPPAATKSVNPAPKAISHEYRNKAKDLLRQHEGVRNRLYYDTRNIPHVGVGFNLNRPDARRLLKWVGVKREDVMRGKKISAYQINALFKFCFEEAEKEAKRYVPNFDKQPDDVKIILINMVYNLGNNLADFSDFLAAVQTRNYHRAAKEMKNSPWYHQVGERSKELVDMMLGATV